MADIDYDVGLGVWEKVRRIAADAGAVAQALAPLGEDVVHYSGAKAAGEPHTLVYFFHDDGYVHVAAVPDEEISPAMSAAIASADGMHYVVGDQVSEEKWLGVMRLMLALGAIEFDEVDVIQSDIMGKTLITGEEAEELSYCWDEYCEEPVELSRKWTRVVTLRFGN